MGGPLACHHYPHASPFPQLGLFSLQQHALASAFLHKHLGLPHVPLFQPPPPAASSLPAHLAAWPAYYSAPPSAPPMPDVIMTPASSSAAAGPSRTEALRIPPPAHLSMSASASSGSTKDAIMSSSIESLRFRARQHAASLGIFENL